MYRTFSIKIYFMVLVIAMCFSGNHVFAQKAGSSTKAGQQKKAEKGLRDNRYYIYYINTTITNFGSDEDKKYFQDVVKRDLVAQFFYLRFMFDESYREIRNAQKTMIYLYQKKIIEDYQQVMSLMDEFAHRTIISENALAREYLHLGYRNAKTAVSEKVMADNYKASLYSMRLHKYSRAMKRLKEAKRFAFLVFLEVGVKDSSINKNKILKYEEIKKLIEKYAGNDVKNFYLEMHADSYYRAKDGKTLYDVIWENPDLENYQLFKDYIKKSD